MKTISTIGYALSYIKAGVSIIPLYSPFMDRNNSTKNDERYNLPLISDWEKFQKRVPTEDEIIDGFTKYSSANIGIVTGEVSGLEVLEVGTQEGVEFVKIMGGFEEDTPVVTKGCQQFYFFEYNKSKIKDNIAEKFEINVIGDGGVVVAPPSMSNSFERYKWQINYIDYNIKQYIKNNSDYIGYNEDQYAKHSGDDEIKNSLQNLQEQFRHIKKIPAWFSKYLKK